VQSNRFRNVSLMALAIAGLGTGLALTFQSINKVGDLTGRGILVNTGQWIKPDGQLTVFADRPVDVVLSTNGKTAYVKESTGLTIIDVASNKILQRVSVSGASSHTGLALSADGSKLYYSNGSSNVVEIDVAVLPAKVARTFTMPRPAVGGAAYPCDLLLHDGKLFAALSRSNQVAEINLETGKVDRTMDVAPAPFGLAIDKESNSLWVSSWGRTPQPGQPKSNASGTPVAVDRRGIATGGTVSQISIASGKATKSVLVGGQPCELEVRHGQVYVAVANNDELIAINASSGKWVPLWNSSVGAAPSSLTLLASGQVAVACGGSNEVVVLSAGDFTPIETYRSGWYPTAVRAFENNLVVASAKGLGGRRNDLRNGKFDTIATTEKLGSLLSATEAKSRGVYQFTGTLSIIPRTSNTQKPEALAAIQPPRKNIAAKPIPERAGEPSVLKHVIYVLKENRTYDQVFGDIPGADGDPSLCIYGEDITPNHHALAKEFVLLDNYYCNGVLSADGHSWSTEGNASTYFERSFGGWTRSYPFGDDPLAISSTGHIWDAVLDKGLTFRNYGEYDYASPSKGEKHTAILKDFQSGAPKIKFNHKIEIERLKKYSHPECPGWNMEIPDVLRASYFLKDLKTAEKTGKLPNFNFVYLPQDHTSGTGAGAPAPTAHMADNDLALGQIVDAVSKSKFWKNTVIFVIEDDPQAGFDHVDGHRSICLVVSPYTRRGAVVSKFYNQGSVLKTVRHVLGLKPATRFEIQANLMTDCFQAKPNLKAYNVRPNRVALDLMNPTRTTSRTLDLKRPDTVDENEFNRQLWTAAKGNIPYPATLAGAHGKGLAAKGLKIDQNVTEQD
jgi:DNA-binding beta-propeller fold protein YncE